MKILIYAGSILATIIILFVLFASDDKAVAYRIASKIIGHPPQDGDGAFQFPLAWILLIITGAVIGWLLGYLMNKFT